MLTLAMDTSTGTGSVALGDDKGMLAEAMLPVRATHSETVLPGVADLLQSSGHAPTELGSVVVGSGPGSFTGVRIGAALAKGIAFASGARLFAYSSLAALAAGCGRVGRVCALIDARRGQVYAAGYDVHRAGVEEVFEPVVLAISELLARTQPPREWVAVGLVQPEAETILHRAGVEVLPSDRFGLPRAASLIWLASVMPDQGRIENPASWEPSYVRLPAAQRALLR